MVDQREAEELARTLEIWASLAGPGSADPAAEVIMLQAAALIRDQAAVIATLRGSIHRDKPATCC